jgi:hypothetical protein
MLPGPSELSSTAVPHAKARGTALSTAGSLVAGDSPPPRGPPAQTPVPRVCQAPVGPGGSGRIPARLGPRQVPGRWRITASISSISRGAREIHSTPVAVTM